MKCPFPRLSSITCALLLCGAAQAAPPGPAVSAAELSAAQARHAQDVAACKSGRSTQDRAACLREAGAALMEAKRGGLGSGSQPYSANQFLRCDPLPADQRKDCIARMQGQGTTSGSVAGGGIYRELVTREAGAASAATPAVGAAPPDKSKPR
ncbi:MAG: hypothetical protein IH627_15940 [Rubrivivax sp.]|nr:hypothetical protein [Rubrivivax sp.]